MELGLKGKQMFITGGSIGIGLGVARAMAQEGVEVAIGARNRERVDAAVRSIIEDFGVRAIGIGMDVTKPDDIIEARRIVEEEFGGIDILINNAGTGSEETIMEADDDRWNYYWNLHVMAAVRTSRAFAPFMKERGGGVILNTSSVCAIQPLWYEPIYNTTKAALVMFGKCLAEELIKDNIRVNTINPGLILTPDWQKTAGLLSKKEGISPQEYLDRIAVDFAPIKRFATTEELANAYVFLASDAASYCVGSTYYVDGGMIRVVI